MGFSETWHLQMGVSQGWHDVIRSEVHARDKFDKCNAAETPETIFGLHVFLFLQSCMSHGMIALVDF